MVLSSPAPGALPGLAWFARIDVAIQLSTRGVLTLIEDATPGQLRAVWLRLLALDPAAHLVVTARDLFELPDGALVLYAPDPEADGTTLNLMRPIVASRRYRIVLWCEPGVSDQLLARAPDFFDWITARVDCPWRPLPHAIATILAAYRARAPVIVWDGPDLERTLAWLRPNRPIRQTRPEDYAAMVDTLGEPRTWVVVNDVSDEYAAQRVAFALLESGRRTPSFVDTSLTRDLRQAWFEVDARPYDLRTATSILGPALAPWLGSEPDAAVAAQLDAATVAVMLDALRNEDDAGPVVAAHSPRSPWSWGSPSHRLARRPRAVAGDRAHTRDEYLRAWKDASWGVRAAYALLLAQYDVAAWWFSRAQAQDRTPWIAAEIAWRSGDLMSAMVALTSASGVDAHTALLRAQLLRELEQHSEAESALGTVDEPGFHGLRLRVEQWANTLASGSGYATDELLDRLESQAPLLVEQAGADAALALGLVAYAQLAAVAERRISPVNLPIARARLEQAKLLVEDDHGEYHPEVIELVRERAYLELVAGAPAAALVAIDLARDLAKRIYPFPEHPERAKLDYVAAVAAARQGDLFTAAALAEVVAATCRARYPETHSSHTALDRLRMELKLRRGHVATWTHYTTRPAEPTRGWWLRPAFSLRYVPPSF